MRKIICALCLSLCGVIVTAAPDIKPEAASAKVSVVVEDAGFWFASKIFVDGDDSRVVCRATDKTAKFQLDAGVHVFQPVSALEFLPQQAHYVVEENGKEVSRSAAVFDPYRIELKQGQVLRIRLLEHAVPHHTRLFKLRGVKCSLYLRSDWFHKLEPGTYKGSAYPNAMMNIAVMGPEACFGGLAKVAAARICGSDKKQADLGLVISGVDLAFYWGLCNGEAPPELQKMPQQQLEKELKAELLQQWQEMLKTSVRSYSVKQWEDINKSGYLPKNVALMRNVPLTQALEFAKDASKKWKEKQAKKNDL